MNNGGQSNVVGIILLLGITVISISMLTAGIGAVIQEASSSVRTLDTETSVVELRDDIYYGQQGHYTLTSSNRYLTIETFNISIVSGTTEVFGDSRSVIIYRQNKIEFSVTASAVIRTSPTASQFIARPLWFMSNDDIIIQFTKLSDSVPTSEKILSSDTINFRKESEKVRLDADTYTIHFETSAPMLWKSYFREYDLTATVGADKSVSVEFSQAPIYIIIHTINVENQ